VFLLGCSIGNAQPTRALAEADSLAVVGLFQKASVEYERVLFLDGALESEVLLKKAQCQKRLGYFRDAIYTLKRIPTLDISDTLRCRILYETSLCMYLAGQGEKAWRTLMQARGSVADSSLCQDQEYLEVVIAAETEQWTNARLAAQRYAQRRGLQIEIDTLEMFKDPTGICDVEAAERLSALLPGLGMIYVGEVKDGLVSLLFQSAFVVVAVERYVTHHIIAAVGIGANLTLAFHQGGVRHTRYLAERANARVLRQKKEAIKEWVLSYERN
jgi:hypothetical protein